MITTSNDNDVIENYGDEMEETTNVEDPNKQLTLIRKMIKLEQKELRIQSVANIISGKLVNMVKREPSVDGPTLICVNLL